MIIVLQAGLSDEQLRDIEDHVKRAGASPVLVEGKERSVVAVIGAAKLEMGLFEQLPGVAQVMRVSKPYKLASREVKREDTIVRVGDVAIGGDQVVVMAGPCSVENRKMLLESAQKLSAMGVTILRGGAYKPRTSPYAFQGMGEDGLKLLEEAREMTGMKIVTEVMSPDKVEIVARYADILQIGARNMQNFDLLKECAEIRKPVLLKRGLSATIEEWLQSAEYILSTGKNRDVILCERGIRTFETSTRNTMDLNAVPVLHEKTHLPVIVDPSHGTGVRAYVAPMAMAAIAAGADGVMLECHPDPEKALSDGPQSLTFDLVERLLRDLEAIAPVVGKRLGLSHRLPATPKPGKKHHAPAHPEAVAFQGEHGAFSEKAVRQYFGDKAKTSPSGAFRDVFEKVVAGDAAYGVVPVENTLGGSIHQNYDLLMEFDVQIVGETKLRVVHNLIANKGTKFSEIRRIYAHPQAAAQCEKLLRQHPTWSVLQVYDTAGSVKMIKEEKALDAAAIASSAAAKHFDMEILREGIESDPQNYTRFIVIARDPLDASKNGSRIDKVSLVYGAENRPGALFRTLEVFARRGVNLSRLESRPIPGKPFEYLFYVDLTGDLHDKAVSAALRELKEHITFVKVLGCYPSA
ncbi:MAG TPA: 3-deoxy-7-phosphoheptulonate synthase [Planctomycetota bacterium]|nr:3-deoxy-7-phosphoheptulonate synthase [Planctomycetota bacterium]